MKNITLEEITKACGGSFRGKAEEQQRKISQITTDSRQAKSGCLFIPIKGERVDGHDFIPTVMECGAVTLSEHDLEEGLEPYIKVESSLQAIKDVAEYYRSILDIKVVGVVGSVGKTSTKEMIAAVLEQRFKVLKTSGNFNNEIGLPLTIFQIEEEHEIAVLEMGISDFGEMHRLSKVARPDICVMTNIGQCHLEHLKTRDGILKAKSEVFDFMKEDAGIVLNGDDDKLATIKQIKGIIPRFFGMQSKGGSQALDNGVAMQQLTLAKNIKDLGMRGIQIDLPLCGQQTTLMIAMPGVHNVYNAMAAALVGEMLGMTAQEIKAGIENAKTIQGRSHFIDTEQFVIIDDCYNANPVSMKASIDVLTYAEGRKIAVLGDMGELGAREKQLHYEVGAYAAEKQIDVLFLTGELSEEMQRGAKETDVSMEIYYFKEKAQMIEKLLSYARKNDTILVKASHFMEFHEVVEALEKWTEK